MIPILFSTTETAFTSNGIGRLTDCVSCLVTEERNGVYELELVYPATGKHYATMIAGGIIGAIHDDAHDLQPFDIYAYSQPIDGLVTFKARHISYRLNKIAVQPYNATSAATALAGIATNAINTCPFTFSTTKTGSKPFAVMIPKNARAILGGSEGSILDVFGKGEYKWDKWEVKLYNNRGSDKGKQIRYGKNLTEFTREVDSGETVNSIVPYWRSGDGSTLVTLPEWYVSAPGTNDVVCTVMDFSDKFQDAPTVSDLRTAATDYLTNNEPWVPKDNITLDFTQLWQTTEYENYASLERVNLCDLVSVYYTQLGVVRTGVKVIKVTYDVLGERYTKMELGDTMPSFAEVLLGPYATDLASIKEKASYSDLDAAIMVASDLITGGLGGHVVISRNGNGEPEEILIMDTDDTSTAVNVWRWNMGGLGHSSTGYNGPFSDVAITQDGKINADMILSGYLSSSRIQANTIGVDKLTGTISNGDWEIDLENGTMTIGSMKSADFVPANDGIYSAAGMCLDMSNKTLKATDFAVTKYGKMYASAAEIAGIDFTRQDSISSYVVTLSVTQGDYNTTSTTLPYRELSGISVTGISRPTADMFFEYYDNGTLVETITKSSWTVSPLTIPYYDGSADRIKIGIVLEPGETVSLGVSYISTSKAIVNAPSNSYVTFQGPISVDGVTVDSTKFSNYDAKLSDLGNGNVKFKRFTINASGTYNLAVAALEHGILVLTSRATGACGQYLIFCGSNNTIYTTTVKAGSSITLTGSANQLAIANGSTSYAAYGLFITY